VSTISYHLKPVTRSFPIRGEFDANGAVSIDIARLKESTGGFYVASITPDGTQVIGRIFNEDSTPRTGELKVDDDRTGDKFPVSATALPNGSLVTFFGNAQDGDHTIRGRMLDRDSHLQKDLATPKGTFDQGVGGPSVAPLKNGGFVLAYNDFIAETAIPTFQRYSADGEQVGQKISFVRDIPDGPIGNPSIAGLANGGFVASADFSDVGGFEWENFKRFSANGKPLDKLPRWGNNEVGDHDQGESGGKTVGLLDGGFAVAFRRYHDDNNGIILRIYNANGTPRTEDIKLNEKQISFKDLAPVDLTVLSNGAVAVSWRAGASDIRAQVFDRHGNPLTDATSLSAGAKARQTAPVIESLQDGKLVAAWGSEVGSKKSIQGREFQLFRTIKGDETGEKLSGNNLSDIIVGNGGNDTLDGGFGRDRLTGGTGADIFRFSRAPGLKNADWITDFTVGEDTINLAGAAFQPLRAGKLAASAFHKGSAAHDANDHIIYNPVTGVLSFDPDGIGNAPVKAFANIAKGLALTYHDFWVT